MEGWVRAGCGGGAPTALQVACQLFWAQLFAVRERQHTKRQLSCWNNVRARAMQDVEVTRTAGSTSSCRRGKEAAIGSPRLPGVHWHFAGACADLEGLLQSTGGAQSLVLFFELLVPSLARRRVPEETCSIRDDRPPLTLPPPPRPLPNLLRSAPGASGRPRLASATARCSMLTAR